MKRLLDVCAAAAALVLLSPVFLAVAVVVRLRLGSPVLFVQTRPGLGCEPFRVYKFRTMRDAVDSSGVPLPDEARLTRLGRFLRSTSLDELPQFWNVLRGDMSLVGPRPLLAEYLDLYTAEQARRQLVRPGMTSLTAINGRNDVSWEEQLRQDVWYVDHRSFWLDLKIIVRTLVKVVRREGVAQAGHATRERFGARTGEAPSRGAD